MSLARITLDRRRFPPEGGRRRRRRSSSQPRIAAVEGLEDQGDRDVGERPAIPDVLHVPPPGDVERMEQRVLAPVEVERADAEALAEAPVESRRRFDPTIAEEQLRVPVIVK